MRIDRKLVRLKRLWIARHGTAWLVSALLIGTYAVMVVEQIRAALSAVVPAERALVASAEEGSAGSPERPLELASPGR